MNSLHQFLTAIDVPLGQIYLDPNNPRFTVADWEYIPEAHWDKQDIQDASMRRMISDFDAEKLRMNMEVNGYLPIDRVIVKKFSDDKYLVLEGNRRICAAKAIGEISLDGTAVSDAVRDSIQHIPCLLYTGTDTDAAWIFQGLRHISGVSEWSAFNKAKLLVEQMEKESLSLTEVGKRFGLTSHGAGQWIRGYQAFNQARQASDQINEVDERAYPYFQELFGRSSAAIREWLEWDESKYEFSNKLNLEEFISWLYPRQETGDESSSPKKGDFDHRRIARRDDLRQISYLYINAKDLFEQFRAGSDIETCFSLSLAKKFEEDARKNSNPISDLFSAIEACAKAIDQIPYKAMRDDEVKEKIFGALSSLETKITEIKS